MKQQMEQQPIRSKREIVASLNKPRSMEFLPNVHNSRPTRAERELLQPDLDKWAEAAVFLQTATALISTTEIEYEKNQTSPITQSRTENIPAARIHHNQGTNPVEPQRSAQPVPVVEYTNTHELTISYAVTLQHLMRALADPVTGVLTKQEIISNNLKVLMDQLEYTYGDAQKPSSKIIDDLSRLGYSYAFSIVVKELFVALLQSYPYTHHLDAIIEYIHTEQQHNVNITGHRIVSFKRKEAVAR